MMIAYLIITVVVTTAILLAVFNSRIRKGFIEKRLFDELTEKSNQLTTDLALEREKVNGFEAKINERDIAAKQTIEEHKSLQKAAEARVDELSKSMILLQTDKATAVASLDASKATIKSHEEHIEALRQEMTDKTNALLEATQKVAELNATLTAANEKLETHKTELESIRKQFNLEFENIASKILEEKSEKFSKLNHENITAILKPLGENLDTFKKKVEEVYDKESKERFSLGKEVEKLVLLNQKISEEANNLTNALKGNSKTQGDWGQMILENILEKSGLVKDREYFVQDFLKDDSGNYLKNADGSKLQPDVTIAYPDNRKVIIDSKVSLIAYTRYVAAETQEEQRIHVEEHLKSIRKHVDDLSKKSYQDFAPSLDFVMMFIPNEPAYLLALQKDPELWHYAYSKRVLLISPTNLIAALKLIVDLWKREYQNRNAQEIAERGGALYDKFANFMEDMKDIEGHLGKTQKSFTAALNKLKEGPGNLVGQAEKLKQLGIKNKKQVGITSQPE
jgi:DNA recombination protein RmuC